mgnify:CR=1 FL=1
MTDTTLRENIKGICGDAILCNADPSETADRILALVSARGPVMPISDLYALCEETTEDDDDGTEFTRGRRYEAKHIAKAVCAAGYGEQEASVPPIEAAVVQGAVNETPSGPVMPEEPSDAVRRFLIKEGWADDCIDPNWADIRAALLD